MIGSTSIPDMKGKDEGDLTIPEYVGCSWVVETIADILGTEITVDMNARKKSSDILFGGKPQPLVPFEGLTLNWDMDIIESFVEYSVYPEVRRAAVLVNVQGNLDMLIFVDSESVNPESPKLNGNLCVIMFLDGRDLERAKDGTRKDIFGPHLSRRRLMAQIASSVKKVYYLFEDDLESIGWTAAPKDFLQRYLELPGHVGGWSSLLKNSAA